MQHKGTVQLESARLLLRKFKIEDAYNMYNNWANDDEVTKYLTWKTHSGIEESRQIINEWIAQYDNNNFYQWAIVLKENNLLIGSIAAVDINDNADIISIGYCISKKYWHKGITSEAFSILIKFFFEEVKANRIDAKHNINNPNSGKVMLKCGLKKEGILRSIYKDNTGLADAAIYSILSKEYFN
ncbi:GNAT family N-acetyltransferase [Brachyspira alvinipulli]|uniref:GNAT family N-acetyltransferase n=1 Tax=Brachyspira alvinipulli TaxID=84379 RepID=UPI00048214BA|nr:GNAT family N-acetyltransferase [Brachyspira alvinipulli]